MEFNRFKSKLSNIIKEDRKSSISYRFFLDKKQIADETTSIINKVVAVLSSKRKEYKMALAVAMTFKDLDKKIKDLKEKQDSLKDKIKETIVKKYFDASDELYTRVIEMSEATITVSKKETRKQTDTFDVDGFFKELMPLVKGVEKQVLSLKNKYTEVGKEIEVQSKVSVKMNESLSSLFDYLRTSFRNFLNIFDTKFERLKRKYNI